MRHGHASVNDGTGFGGIRSHASSPLYKYIVECPFELPDGAGWLLGCLLIRYYLMHVITCAFLPLASQVNMSTGMTTASLGDRDFSAPLSYERL